MPYSSLVLTGVWRELARFGGVLPKQPTFGSGKCAESEMAGKNDRPEVMHVGLHVEEEGGGALSVNIQRKCLYIM